MAQRRRLRVAARPTACTAAGTDAKLRVGILGAARIARISLEVNFPGVPLMAASQLDLADRHDDVKSR